MTRKILVVDDEESVRFTFDNFLTEAGYDVICVTGCDDAEHHLRHTDFDLIFADIFLEQGCGIDLLKAVNQKNPNLPVIIITGAPSIDTATECLRYGALDYIVKPVRQEALLRATNIAIRQKAITDEKEKCRLNFEAIFQSVKEGIISVDARMDIVEINAAASRLCGVQRAAVLGKNIKGIVNGCQGKCQEVMQQLFISGKPVESSFVECKALHDEQQVVSLTASPLLQNGEVVSGAVLLIRDETPFLKLQKRLEEYLVPGNIVGKSAKMQKIYTQIKELAMVESTVLIAGESGTGKELIVDALHFNGRRRDKPLVKVNCAALSENLLESELFGHVIGAFTGAVKNKIGRFERADGGTLFLDEIGDISPTLQQRLLRVLETMEFERVGDSRPIKVDVRVITATNHDLKEKMMAHEFRSDLYYRLNVIQLNLPPLRERQEDIHLLVDHFISVFNKKFNKKISGTTIRCLKMLTSYKWPGNVRELKNVMEHCCIRCAGRVITSSHLPVEWHQPIENTNLKNLAAEEDEVQLIQQALLESHWNKSKAAAKLGISRRSIYRKLEKYCI